MSGSYHLIVGWVACASRRLRFPLAHLLRVGEEIELHVGVGVSPILQGLLHTHTHTQASVSVPQRNNQKPQIPGQDLDPLIDIKILFKKHFKNTFIKIC